MRSRAESLAPQHLGSSPRRRHPRLERLIESLRDRDGISATTMSMRASSRLNAAVTEARLARPVRRMVIDAHYSTPLCSGPSSSPVVASAARSASAQALNDASERWWSLSPRRQSTWRDAHRDGQRLEHVGDVLGGHGADSLASKAQVDHRRGLPERSTTTRTSASSIGQ